MSKKNQEQINKDRAFDLVTLYISKKKDLVTFHCDLSMFSTEQLGVLVMHLKVMEDEIVSQFRDKQIQALPNKYKKIMDKK